jgi:hypothetical protein
MNQLHETTELTEALTALATVKTVSYEFPGFWNITLKNNLVFALGNVDGFWAWHDIHGITNGDTQKTDAHGIALDFAEWLKGLSNA